MVKYGDEIVYWCSVCNECCIGKFGIYNMSEDRKHWFDNRFVVSNSERNDMFYKIQREMSPSNIDMIEPVLKWIKKHIEADYNFSFNHYKCNGVQAKASQQIETTNAITAAIRGY